MHSNPNQPTSPPENPGSPSTRGTEHAARSPSTAANASSTRRPSTPSPCSRTDSSWPRNSYTRRAGKPMIEQRPKRSPPSTDSNSYVYGPSASFRYTDSGVSRSDSTSRTTATRVYPAAANPSNSSRVTISALYPFISTARTVIPPSSIRNRPPPALKAIAGTTGGGRISLQFFRRPRHQVQPSFFCRAPGGGAHPAP